MKIIKHLETRIDISDVNDMFCNNYNDMILNLLKKKFKNKCYKSVYILDIIEIIRRSKLHCKSKNLNGESYVDVQFSAECLIYEKGEIIHNCKIIQITERDIILAKTTFCAVHIKNITKLDIFKESEEMPVIVKAVRYNLFDTEIAISGIPLVPIPRDLTKFRITNNELIEDVKETKYIMDLEKKISNFNNKAVKFFRDLIYPHKKYEDYKKIAERVKIKDFINLQINDIVFMGDKYLDEDIFYKYLNDDADIDITKQELYEKVLIEYKKDLHNMLGLLENYDINKIKKSATLWKVYNSLKK